MWGRTQGLDCVKREALVECAFVCVAYRWIWSLYFFILAVKLPAYNKKYINWTMFNKAKVLLVMCGMFSVLCLKCLYTVFKPEWVLIMRTVSSGKFGSNFYPNAMNVGFVFFFLVMFFNNSQMFVCLFDFVYFLHWYGNNAGDISNEIKHGIKSLTLHWNMDNSQILDSSK